MNTILEIKDLKKNYRNFSLNSISFDVKEGEIVGFIGPNGSGKSTTMQILMGIREKDGGTIRFDGKEVFEDKPEYKQKIGYVGESLDFYEKVKLRKIYQFVRSLYPDWNDELFHELIRTFDLSLDKKNRENSKGMKVKFCLALALATNPKLLILD
ncbi:MAG TPA: ABC transporter ATP-binding protein, partial [Thermotogota bacterium]|nr:ABC transporter ATP-binding protein [Thermotogota bacterium]